MATNGRKMRGMLKRWERHWINKIRENPMESTRASIYVGKYKHKNEDVDVFIRMEERTSYETVVTGSWPFKNKERKLVRKYYEFQMYWKFAQGGSIGFPLTSLSGAELETFLENIRSIEKCICEYIRVEELEWKGPTDQDLSYIEKHLENIGAEKIVECPNCGSEEIKIVSTKEIVSGLVRSEGNCNSCKHTWSV